MPSYLPTFTPPNYKKEHGDHAFMNLSNYKKSNPLKLYRSDKDETKLTSRDYIMFYGTDLRGIQPYIKNNTYYEWTLSKEDKESLFDLTDIKNQQILNERLTEPNLKTIKTVFFKTSQSIEEQKMDNDNNNENSVVFKFETEFEDLEKEKTHYEENNILYVRKSDDVGNDIKFANIMKTLFPEYKGIYTKCLKPLFGDSLSHAEIIIWDEELNKRLFQTGTMKKKNITSSSRSRSPRRSGSFGSPRSPKSPKRSGSFGSPMRSGSPRSPKSPRRSGSPRSPRSPKRKHNSSSSKSRTKKKPRTPRTPI